VQVFEYRNHRVRPVLAQQQATNRLVGVLPMLKRIERLERMSGVQGIKQIQQRRNHVLQRRIERQYLARHLLADRPRAVAYIDLEVILPQQFNHRQVGRCVAV